MTYRYVATEGEMKYVDSHGTSWQTMINYGYKYQNGSNTQGFRGKSRPKPLPFNDYSMDMVKHTPGTRSYEYIQYFREAPYKERFSSQMTGQQSDFLFPKNEIEAEVAKKLAAKTLSQLKDMKVNVAQAAAESHQVASMLTGTARRITSSFANLRRGNIIGAAKALSVQVKPKTFTRYQNHYAKNPLDAAASAWLELQYGWKPLLQDAYGFAESLAKQQGSRPHYNKCVVSVTVERGIDNGSRQVTANYSNVYQSGGRVVSKGRNTILYTVDNPAYNLASSVGLTDPALLAWELMPYSFVVDWFLPVGNWLTNMNATAGLSFQGGCTSIHTIASGGTAYNYSSWQDGVFSTTTKLVDAKVEIQHLRRTVMGGFPTNPLPTFKNPISLTHCANAIALLTSTFGRK